MHLDPEDLRRFARRDWGAPARLSRKQRVERPVAEKIAMAIELYEAARATRPGWPDHADRRRDLEMHIRLKSLLRRAAHVGTHATPGHR
jgi:hypothetical protein